MKLHLVPHTLSGSITPPASKSQAHRFIMGAALAGGVSHLSAVSDSKDISATLACMKALGASANWQDSSHTSLCINGSGAASAPAGQLLDCGESGSTLRFLIPVALALTDDVCFRGHGRLMQRPQGPYFELFQEKGISYHAEGDLLSIHGSLTPGLYRLRGDISSQFITGLLYALPLLPGGSHLQLTTPLESESYVHLSLDALRQFGIKIERTDDGWYIPGRQHYLPLIAAVEPDFSQAGFFYAAQAIGNPLTVSGMREDSVQGDRIVLEYLRKFSSPGAITLDVRDCPDLVPPLALAASLQPGLVTTISNAGRLRIKESDRLASVTQVLCALGADIQEHPESLTIRGVPKLSGGVTVDSWNDHRIAMMTAIAATACRAPVMLTGAESVSKSYPRFWSDYRRLGGIAEEVMS